MVHDHQTARTHHGADGFEGFVVDFDVQVLFGYAAARRTANLNRLVGHIAGNAVADVEDNLTQGGAHGHFDEAGVVHFTGKGEDLGALALLGADGGEPFGSVIEDGGDIGQGFDIVDDRGFAEQSRTGREGGAGARHAAFPLDGGHQGGFLAADKGTGSHFDDEFQRDAAVENILTEEAVFSGVLDGLAQPGDGQGILCTDIYVGF